MKNTNFKTKLIARVMLVILLISGVLPLGSCNGGWGSTVDKTVSFASNDEFIDFIERYNSKNDGFVYTFIDFNFSDSSQIKMYRYDLHTAWKSGYGLDKMYDDDHSQDNGFSCEMIFHMNEFNAQIQCKYSTKNYNFYQNDNISLEFVDSYKAYAPDGVHKEWADLRTFNFETLDYDEYYDYMYVYQISINEKEEVTVKITSENEILREKLDEIVQFFIDNIVIINTEE